MRFLTINPKILVGILSCWILLKNWEGWIQLQILSPLPLLEGWIQLTGKSERQGPMSDQDAIQKVKFFKPLTEDYIAIHVGVWFCK